MARKFNEYVGKLTGVRRRVYGHIESILITDVYRNDRLFRDHCWVPLNDILNRMSPLGHNKPILVTFEAKVSKYSNKGETKVTLKHIKNVELSKKEIVNV